MEINSLGLISIVFYTAWNVWTLSDKIKRHPIKDFPINFIINAAYLITMLYFLSIMSINFLILATIITIFRVIFGMFVELFKPEMNSSELSPTEIMKS